MVALEDLAKNENLVAFQIGNQVKKEVADKTTAELKNFITLDLANAFNAGTATLEAYKGKTVEIKVFLEKDGVKAEDTYTIEFAK